LPPNGKKISPLTAKNILLRQKKNCRGGQKKIAASKTLLAAIVCEPIVCLLQALQTAVAAAAIDRPSYIPSLGAWRWYCNRRSEQN